MPEELTSPELKFVEAGSGGWSLQTYELSRIEDSNFLGKTRFSTCRERTTMIIESRRSKGANCLQAFKLADVQLRIEKRRCN